MKDQLLSNRLVLVLPMLLLFFCGCPHKKTEPLEEKEKPVRVVYTVRFLEQYSQGSHRVRLAVYPELNYVSKKEYYGDGTIRAFYTDDKFRGSGFEEVMDDFIDKHLKTFFRTPNDHLTRVEVIKEPVYWTTYKNLSLGGGLLKSPPKLESYILKTNGRKKTLNINL